MSCITHHYHLYLEIPLEGFSEATLDVELQLELHGHKLNLVVEYLGRDKLSFTYGAYAGP